MGKRKRLKPTKAERLVQILKNGPASRETLEFRLACSASGVYNCVNQVKKAGGEIKVKSDGLYHLEKDPADGVQDKLDHVDEDKRFKGPDVDLGSPRAAGASPVTVKVPAHQHDFNDEGLCQVEGCVVTKARLEEIADEDPGQTSHLFKKPPIAKTAPHVTEAPDISGYTPPSDPSDPTDDTPEDPAESDPEQPTVEEHEHDFFMNGDQCRVTGCTARPADQPSQSSSAPADRRCQFCSCTDQDCSQCVEKTGQPCFRVRPDLCSRCAGERVKEILDFIERTRSRVVEIAKELTAASVSAKTGADDMVKTTKQEGKTRITIEVP